LSCPFLTNCANPASISFINETGMFSSFSQKSA
jgi:hypothetical protein